MEHRKPDDDQPIGAPHIEETDEAVRPFEIGNPVRSKKPQDPPKTWKTMPTWKKIFVISFSIVCAFGVYDTLFPSEKSLKWEELMPIVVTQTVTPSPTVTPQVTITQQAK